MSYTINIIGAGNVAWHLCNALAITNHKVQQILSRSEEPVRKLANTFGLDAITDYYDLKQSDILIIAVNDDQIDDVSKKLEASEDRVVLHTSGTVPITAYFGR